MRLYILSQSAKLNGLSHNNLINKYVCARVRTLKEIVVHRLSGKRKQLHGIEYWVAQNVFKKFKTRQN